MAQRALETSNLLHAQHKLEDAQAGALIEHELLVEDVSIDGMCGVY